MEVILICVQLVVGHAKDLLGPLLFLIYINNLPNASTKFISCLFADNTNIYCESNELSELINIVN